MQQFSKFRVNIKPRTSVMTAPVAHLLLLSPGSSWLVLVHRGLAQQVVEEADEKEVVVEEVEGEEEEVEEGGLFEEG